MPGSDDFDSGGSSRITERPRTGNAWAGIRLPRELLDKGGPARPHRPPGSLRHRAGHGVHLTAWLAGLLAVAVLGISGTAWALVTYSESRIGRIDAFAGLTNRPARVHDEAVNYLLVGSDTREGIGDEYGSTAEIAGARSDVTIVMHVSKKRDKVVLLSFPRDSLVTIPAHTDDEGVDVKAKQEKLNAALQRGGPPLLIQTLEQLSGLRIDHYLQVDFAGFKDMVEALGGVDICIPEPLQDESAGLDVQAGQQRLDPEQALAFVRARKSDPRGDLGRMDRQQQLLGAMMRQATSAGVLTDPAKLTRFVTAGLDSVTTDQALSSKDLVDLATRLRDLETDHVEFVTVPVEDPNFRRDGISYMVLDQRAAKLVYDALRHDEPLGEEEAPAAAGDDPAAALTVPPGEISVQVLNGTNTNGLGARAAEELERVGFTIDGEAADAETKGVDKTVIRYDPRWEDSFRTLENAIPGARGQAVSGQGRVLQVVVGASWSGADEARVAPPAEPSGETTSAAEIETTTAADRACA